MLVLLDAGAPAGGVGTPKERSDGETLTDDGAAAWPLALTLIAPYAMPQITSARTNRSQTLITASLRGFPIDISSFSAGPRPRPLSCALWRFEGTGTLRLRRPAQRLRRKLSFPHPGDVKKKAGPHTRSSSTTVAERHRPFCANNFSGRPDGTPTDLDKSICNVNI
jgi:hypothetical protein